MDRINDIRMSGTQFTLKDCACRCCGMVKVDGPLWDVILRLVARGYRFSLNCLYRCPKHNAELKGSSPTSLHIEGKAADLTPIGTELTTFATAAVACGAKRVGIYSKSNFVHITSIDQFDKAQKKLSQRFFPESVV